MENNFLKSFGLAAAFSVIAATAAAYSVVPAEGTVAEVGAFEVTFDSNVAWNMADISTETAPSIEWNGVKVGTCTNLTTDQKTLKFAINGEPLTMVGAYTVKVAGSTYTVGGVAGEDLTLNYKVEVNPDAVTINPAVSLQTSLQFFALTFNDAKTVAIAEGATTEDLPTLSIETEPGEWDVRVHFALDVAGNTLSLRCNEPITEEGVYKLTVPGSCYTVDGQAGTDLEFTYQVIPASENAIVVTPAPGEVEEVSGTVSFTFNNAEKVEWNMADMTTETAPVISWNGNVVAHITKLSAKDNVLSMEVPTQTMKGTYEITIPAGSYNVDGEPGAQLNAVYTVAEGGDFVTITPGEYLQTSLQFFTIRFNDAVLVQVTEDMTTEDLPTLEIETENGAWEVRAHMTVSTTGNTMGLSIPTPITEEGIYRLRVPGKIYNLDSTILGTDLEFNYQIIPGTPNPTITVIPVPGVVEELGGPVTFTFNNAEKVEWNMEGMTTETAPAISWNGNVVAHITNLSAEGNVLSMEVPTQTMKGTYEITIPAGSYNVDGEPGAQLNAVYTVAEGGDFVTITPGEYIQTSLQFFTIRFNDAVLVQVTEDMTTEDLPTLEIETENGAWEVRAHMMVSTAGNTMGLSIPTPITEEGIYRLKVPGKIYNLDNTILGTDLEFNYQIIPGTPDPAITVVPAQGVVEQLGGEVTVTFNDAETVVWNLESMSTANCPKVLFNGEERGYVTRLTNDGNTLRMDLNEYAVKGEYVIAVPAGSYSVDGVRGLGFSLKYTVETTLEPVSITPAAGIQNQLQFFSVRFNEATSITVLDNLSTPDLPTLSVETEPGNWEVRAHLTMDAGGNTLGLRIPTPITEEGVYKLNILGSSYLIDGKPGEDLEFTYEVREGGDDSGIVAFPAPGMVESLAEMTVTFQKAETVTWNQSAYSTSNCPYVTRNGEVISYVNNFTAGGNVLTLNINEIVNKGKYTVVIPAGSYDVDGVAGGQLSFNYEIEVSQDPISVSPASNVIPYIQFVEVRFNDATNVAVVENLTTEGLPTLDVEVEPGMWQTVQHFSLSNAGNLLGLGMREPIYTEGYYRVSIPGACYVVDGREGEDLEFFYTVTGEVSSDFQVTPVPGEVDALETISIFFPEAQVAWFLEGMTTQNAPYFTRNGVVEGRFTNLTVAENNTLVLTYTSPIEAKGNYQVVIPGGSYTINGEPGYEITLDYTIDYEGWMLTVSPAEEIQTKLQSFSFMFEDATTVAIKDATMLSENDYPVLQIEKEPMSGEFETVYTFKEASSFGNAFGLYMIEPIVTPGIYRLFVPGNFYVINGMPGEDINLNYEIVAPYAVATVEPAQGEVDGVQYFMLTFGEEDSVAWVEDMTEEMYPVLVDNGTGNVAVTYKDLGGKGNTLALASSEKFGEPGQYTLNIHEGSYTLNGEAGVALYFNYIINGSGIDAVFGADAQNFQVYDFNGRLVNANADRNDLKALKGIYIVNGKKCIFR